MGNVERIQLAGSAIVEWKRYIGGAVYTVRTVNGAVEKTNKSFMFNDHLGSLDVVTDHLGKITHSASFDAWGARRNGENWANSFAASSLLLVGYDQSLTSRGYTGHEMLDDHGLIHMNGRIFDQKLARFMQADPFIQFASSTQSYNRYSYLLNNPLNATDPSGYFLHMAALSRLDMELSKPIFKELAGNVPLSMFVQGVGTVISGVYCGPCSIGFNAQFSKNMAYAQTGSTSQAYKSAAISGATSAVFYAVGNVGGLTPTQGVIAGAVVGGIFAEMQGGNFGTGFVSAGISGIAGGIWPGTPQGMMINAIVGGTISEMTGGKFANGAITAAFSYSMRMGANKYSVGGGETPNYTADGGSSSSAAALTDKRVEFSSGGIEYFAEAGTPVIAVEAAKKYAGTYAETIENLKANLDGVFGINHRVRIAGQSNLKDAHGKVSYAQVLLGIDKHNGYSLVLNTSVNLTQGYWGSVIGHELVHLRDMASTRIFTYNQPLYRSEIAARQWQIKNSATFGDPISVKGLQDQIDFYQKQLK